jgi:hypothetical protein
MNQPQAVILVYSTSHAIRIEKLLNENGISCKLIIVPRQLSSDCGICVRINRNDRTRVSLPLSAAKVEIEGIYDI